MPGLENLAENKLVKQIGAWLFLLLLVWVTGTWFLNALSMGEPEKPSEKLNAPKNEENKATSPNSQNNVSSTPRGRYIGEIQVIQSGVNFRSEPAKGDNVIKTLTRDTMWPVVSKAENDWYEIEVDGEKGYITSSPNYVKIISMNE